MSEKKACIGLPILETHQYGRARTKVGLEGLKPPEDWPVHDELGAHQFGQARTKVGLKGPSSRLCAQPRYGSVHRGPSLLYIKDQAATLRRA